MRKKYLILVISVIILFIVIFYSINFKKSNNILEVTESTSNATSNLTISTSTPSVNAPIKKDIKKDFIFQPKPYIDQVSKFSILLPNDWIVQDKVYSTTTSNVRFGGGSSTIVVSRHNITEEVERVLKQLGPGGLIDVIVNGIVYDFNQYNLVSTENVSIDGVPFRKIVSTYVGVNSKKQVTHYLYVTLRDDSYYFIGIDTYSDIWNKNKESIFQSINTFELL